MTGLHSVRRAGRRTELSESECWELLLAPTVGRVGFDHAGTVKIIPVKYVLAGHEVIIRTDPNSRVTSIVGADSVAFEVDYHNSSTGAGWNVLMDGTATTLSDSEVARLHLGRRAMPQSDGDRSLHLRFVARTIEGRRVLRCR